MQGTLDYITVEEAGSLDGLLRERARRSPDDVAYRYYDDQAGQWLEHTWLHMQRHINRWRDALMQEKLQPGDRVAVMLRNSPEWVMFDQAALSLGLVVVPLYTNDRAENVNYILNDSECRLLLIKGQLHWRQLENIFDNIGSLQRVITVDELDTNNPVHMNMVAWLPGDDVDPPMHTNGLDDLATIVYTSGTTGNPKGVMLSHRNILWSCYSGLQSTDVYREDLFLSFLPLSHMFERNVGYYLPMMSGSTVAYNRSIPQLADDLMKIQPTLLVSVPRIYEQIYNKIMKKLEDGPAVKRLLFRLTVASGWRSFLFSQKRAFWHPLQLLTPLLRKIVARKITTRLGSRMRLSLCGGAAMPFEIGRTFIGLGVTMAQGYGLTECSPTVSFNRLHDNIPESIGEALPGVEVSTGDKDELLVRSPSVMLGYWHQEQATREAIDEDGWLHTGDQVKIENNHIYITGRLKDILVMSNGENVPPADIEAALDADVLIDQSIVVGDNRQFLSAILVLNPEEWRRFAEECEVDPDKAESIEHARVKQKIIKRLEKRMRNFPGYTKIKRVILELNPWTIEDGLLTPTLKPRRPRILKKYASAIDALYQGL